MLIRSTPEYSAKAAAVFAKSFTHPRCLGSADREAGCKRDLGWAAAWEGARLRCPISTGALKQHGDNHALDEGSNAAWTGSSWAPAPPPPFPPRGHQQESTNSLKSHRELPFQPCEAMHGLPKSQLGMHCACTGAGSAGRCCWGAQAAGAGGVPTVCPELPRHWASGAGTAAAL